MTRRITAQTTLDNLRKEAKRWLKQLRANDAEARARFHRATEKEPDPAVLRGVQHALALEYGFSSWTSLKQAAEEPSAAVQKYEQLVNDMVTVYASGDADAMQRINEHYGRSYTVDDLRALVWRLIYKVRQAGGTADAFTAAEAQELIARTAGFNNWSTLTDSVRKGAPSAIHFYTIDTKENSIAPRRDLTAAEWGTLLAVMRERGITVLDAKGFMTDDVVARIAALDRLTSLRLGGSQQLSDDGLLLVSRAPQLEHLDLNEYPGGKLTDRGLEVLRRLPNLRTFQMTWQRGMSDAGAANLKYCEKLESVNLMGSPTGDGAIEALRGKASLRRLDTGRLVTDAGLALLSDFPNFRTWRGGGGSVDEEPTHLLIDGPFTNEGMTHLAALDGLFSLDLFWHVNGITSDAFAPLASLRNLSALGCDGELSNDRAMGHIAAIPRLRKLRAQSSVATDDGFVALSKSDSLERFWGRECPNLTGRGFRAFSRMASLRALGVSCRQVDDEALSSLPDFPALSELTPIGVEDDGFRHVGRCLRLERLSCMYCRDTTDRATESIGGLHLKSYYAGLTKITDRSLEILGRMLSLESIELYETKGVTGAGLLHLVGLPLLREVRLSGLTNVPFAGTVVFPAQVYVQYNV